MPFTTGASAYCFTYDVTHPSAWIALGFFFASCSVLFGIRTMGEIDGI
jgi:hypothetical protein